MHTNITSIVLAIALVHVVPARGVCALLQRRISFYDHYDGIIAMFGY